MEIPSSPEQTIKASSNANATTSANPVRPAELLAQLQAGQTLLAKVEKVLANNQVELRIANQIVKADSPIQLAAGQSIKLLVEDTNKGLILRIAQQASQVETLARALRAALPKQQPIIDVVKQLVNNIASNKVEIANNTIANQIRSAVQALVNTLPSTKTVSQADGLRQAIQNSGVTLEAQLRQSIITGLPPRTDSNLKANFLRLAQVALEIQANAKQNTSATTSDTAKTPSTTGKSNPINAYTSLLATAAKPSTEPDKSLSALRPLLPPLPTATPTSTPTQNTNNVSGLLQRLFSFSPTPITSAQVNVNAVAVQQSPASQQVFSTMLVDLLNQMESGLARIQQHQISNLTNDDAIRHFLNLELPVFNGKTFDNIGIRFEWDKYQDDEDDSDKQHQWRVVLNFDFDELGKTQVIIRAGQNEIHTDFKSENKNTQELFQKNKELLENNFQQQGLKPGKFTFSSGDISIDLTAQHDENLVKTKA